MFVCFVFLWGCEIQFTLKSEWHDSASGLSGNAASVLSPGIQSWAPERESGKGKREKGNEGVRRKRRDGEEG